MASIESHTTFHSTVPLFSPLPTLLIIIFLVGVCIFAWLRMKRYPKSSIVLFFLGTLGILVTTLTYLYLLK